MESLEAELERARDLDVATLADAIESIGFECTRCGACCKSEADDPHTATVFPDEVRNLENETGDEWRDVARPMPYGLTDGAGETFEWALQTDACGDCVFYEENEAETAGDEAETVGTCTVHDARPLVCQTYPFSVALGGTSQPMGGVVEEEGPVRAHECEGLGRDISRADATAMAETLRERAVRELQEAIGVRDGYAPGMAAGGGDGRGDEVVVFDSEGPKRPDGTAIGSADEDPENADSPE